MSHSAARARALESGLTSGARKVLDAVPIVEQWTPAQIQAHVARAGSAIERRVVDGCLMQIVDAGLAKMPRPGYYQRVPARAEPPIDNTKAPNNETYVCSVAGTLEVANSGLDSFARLAQRLREASQAMASLATEIEELGLETEARIEKAGAATGALRQLRDMLAKVE